MIESAGQQLLWTLKASLHWSWQPKVTNFYDNYELKGDSNSLGCQPNLVVGNGNFGPQLFPARSRYRSGQLRLTTEVATFYGVAKQFLVSPFTYWYHMFEDWLIALPPCFFLLGLAPTFAYWRRLCWYILLDLNILNYLILCYFCLWWPSTMNDQSKMNWSQH